MSLLSDIMRSYRAPGEVVLGRLGRTGEAGALALLIGACILIFVSQWPRLAREAAVDPSIALDVRIGGALMAWIFVMPLVLYVVAGLLWAAMRAVGRRVPAIAVRVALFWGLLAVAPLWLAHGAVVGLAGETALADAIGLLVLVAIVWIVLGALRVLPGEAPTA